MCSATARYPVLTDEAIQEARKLIGVELRTYPRKTEASKDNIFSFARAIGSRNPLFQEETYADSTCWGGLIAYPTFLYAVDDTLVAPKLAGIHSIYAGTDWEFYRWVHKGDSLRATRKLTDVVEKEGRFCGRMALQIGEIVYTNQYGNRVAKATSYVMRTPRNAAVERGLYKDMTMYGYTEEETNNIIKLYEGEQIQGNQVRYWEDVKKGEQLVSVVKGPLTSEDMQHFVKTCMCVPLMDYFVEHIKRHPADVYWRPELNMPDTWVASLIDRTVAQEFGFPEAHDAGFQRICWLDNLVTNWMGDLAFLKKLSARVLRPNIYFDTTLCKGAITQKYQHGEEYAVDINVWCENQRHEVTAKGSATVILPSKDPASLPPLVNIPRYSKKV
ncbi:MaoC family dehydratase N-terminal domain-containing protein [Chloroflexota bacterium]